MRVSHTRDPKHFNYSLTGQALEEVMDAKYLGVLILIQYSAGPFQGIMRNGSNSQSSMRNSQ